MERSVADALGRVASTGGSGMGSLRRLRNTEAWTGPATRGEAMRMNADFQRRLKLICPVQHFGKH